MQPKYANSVIYKIVCLDPTITDLYVGSTTNLTRRKYEHKSCCLNPRRNNYNLYVYRFIRDNGGFDNWQFVVVRRYKNIETKEQLLKKERKHMERLKATLNKQVPTRTNQEYCDTHRHLINKNSKRYYDKHKDIINEKSKVKYQETKEEKKEWHRQHYQKIKHIRNGATQCECGCMISKCHLKRHQQSHKHKQLMSEL